MKEGEEHILIDGKVSYEMEELCGGLRWEDAKFLRDQGFKSERNDEKDLEEELTFECEDGLVPKFLIPMGSSRRDLEAILNQLTTLVKRDLTFRNWIIHQVIDFMEERRNLSKTILGYVSNIVESLFGIKVEEDVEDSEKLDARVEDVLIKSVLFNLKEAGESLFLDVCLAFLFMRAKEYDKSEQCLLRVIDNAELEKFGKSLPAKHSPFKI